MTQAAHSSAASPAQPPSPSLTLTGLKAHHPLGFLAACGTLRAVTLQGWSDARLSWSSPSDAEPGQAGERVAVLNSSRLDTDKDKAVDVLIAVLAAQARVDAVEKSDRVTWLNWAEGTKKTDRKINKQCPEHFRISTCQGIGSGQADRTCVDGFSALTTDAILDHDGGLQPTLFDMTSASQGFLDDLKSLADSIKRNTSEALKEALFGPWRYRDDQHTLGWDPTPQRLHPLRNKAPTNDDKKRSVRAAVFLASQALPLFPVFCSQGRPRTTGFARDRRGRDAASGQGRRTVSPSPTADRDDFFTWPIWDRPISFDTLRALLAQPSSRQLLSRGVVALYRSRRAKTGGSQGDYRVLAQPTLQTLP